MPLRDNIEKYGRIVQSTDDNIGLIRSKRFKSWLIKCINTYSECVAFIALPRQQWLREIASMLRISVHGRFFFSNVSYIDSHPAGVPVRTIHFIRRKDCSLTGNVLPKIVPANYSH